MSNGDLVREALKREDGFARRKDVVDELAQDYPESTVNGWINRAIKDGKIRPKKDKATNPSITILHFTGKETEAAKLLEELRGKRDIEWDEIKDALDGIVEETFRTKHFKSLKNKLQNGIIDRETFRKTQETLIELVNNLPDAGRTEKIKQKISQLFGGLLRENLPEQEILLMKCVRLLWGWPGPSDRVQRLELLGSELEDEYADFLYKRAESLYRRETIMKENIMGPNPIAYFSPLRGKPSKRIDQILDLFSKFSNEMLGLRDMGVLRLEKYSEEGESIESDDPFAPKTISERILQTLKNIVSENEEAKKYLSKKLIGIREEVEGKRLKLIEAWINQVDEWRE